MEVWRQELKETDDLISLIETTQFSLTVMEEAIDDAIQAIIASTQTESTENVAANVEHVFSRFLIALKEPLVVYVDHLSRVIEDRCATPTHDASDSTEAIRNKNSSEARLKRKLFEAAYLNARREIYYCEVLHFHIFFIAAFKNRLLMCYPVGREQTQCTFGPFTSSLKCIYLQSSAYFQRCSWS